MKSTTPIDVSYLCKSVVAGAVAATCLAVAPTAEAQSLGRKHDITFAADRLFGFYGIDTDLDPGTDRDMTSYGLAYQSPIGLFDVPRLGIDFFLIQQLSIGGSIGWFVYDPDAPGNNDEDVSGFIFSPRIGYVIPFNAEWGIWPRGGLTYASRDRNDVYHATAFTLEAHFYYMPAPAVGFMLGPVLDLGFSGERRIPGNQDADYEERLFGLAFGMFARF